VALQVITATPRQLESGVRLAEALARMRLSPTVEPSDVREGLRLMQVGCYPLMQLRRLRPDSHSPEQLQHDDYPRHRTLEQEATQTPPPPYLTTGRRAGRDAADGRGSDNRHH
jgi:MCM AAA-lid domain